MDQHHIKTGKHTAAWKGLTILMTVILVMSGCQTPKDNMKADILQEGTQQERKLLEAMTGQKPMYDKAYEKAKNYYAPENPVRGALFGTNLKNKEEIAGFFQRLEKNQRYGTVVLISPAQLSKGGDGESREVVRPTPAAVSSFAYKTPYGILPPPGDILKNIPESTYVSVNDDVAKREAWPKVIAPFVAKSFHQAEFLTVFVNENASEMETEKLADWLNTELPEDTLVIAQTTTKTSHDPTVAEFQLGFMENVLENFDLEQMENLPFNDTVTAQVLERYLSKRKAQKMQNQFMEPATGSFISFSMEGPVYRSRSVFMVAFGDIMLDRMVRSRMDSHSLDYPFEKMDQSYLKSNDILVANLEGPVAKKRVQTGKSIAFRFAPDVVPLLKKYSFDALSEANNHAADMGWSGFNDTFELFAPTGIKIFGNPKEIENRSVATFDVDGQKIAFLGLEEVVYTIDETAAVAKIKELTAQGYKVIPFPHWGIEYKHHPNERQKDLAHKFIDAGAVAVIGAHPHVVQTFEIYNGHPVFYSLGNAIFDQDFSLDTQEGLSVALSIADDQIRILLMPIRIDRSQFSLMNGDERKKFLDEFARWGEYRSEEERQNVLNGAVTLPI